MRRAIMFVIGAIVVTLAVFHGSGRTSYAAARHSAALEAPSVGIVCNLPKRVVRVAPSKCDVLPAAASFAEGLALVGLRWRGWGGSSVTGTGFETGFHLPLSHIPVAVVAYQRVRCSNGAQLYTRVRSSSSYGTVVAQADGCPTTAAFTLCPRTNAVGVDDLRVRGVGCPEARRLAEAGLGAEKAAGFACRKTGEGRGYTAWRCDRATAAFTSALTPMAKR